jgi:GAF domain-containing protein
MSEMAQTQLTDVFVEMADTLTADFDLIEFLHTLTERCVEFLDIAAAGLLLTDGQGNLQLMAASSEQSRLLELFQVQADQGPCLDCFRTGQPVSVADLAADGRWPRFAVAAGEAGFAAVHAIPMRLRAEVIGALNFFDVRPGPVGSDKLRIGQALADVATIGLIQQRAIRDRDVLTEQLQTALNSRVLIEQAKGVLAERLGLDMADAFRLLRSSARNSNRSLSDLAHALVDGTEQITPPPADASAARPKPPPRRRQPGR